MKPAAKPKAGGKAIPKPGAKRRTVKRDTRGDEDAGDEDEDGEEPIEPEPKAKAKAKAKSSKRPKKTR